VEVRKVALGPLDHLVDVGGHAISSWRFLVVMAQSRATLTTPSSSSISTRHEWMASTSGFSPNREMARPIAEPMVKLSSSEKATGE
jgi:hypothetical protein